MRWGALLLLLLAPAAGDARDLPLHESDVSRRIAGLRDETAPRWSTLEVTRVGPGWRPPREGFAWMWTVEWVRPEEFAPALNEQSKDGPIRSFADLRWMAVPGFDPTAKEGRLWFWDGAGPLLSTSAFDDATLLATPAPEARVLRGSLCAVLAELAGRAASLPARCVARRGEGGDQELNVAAGEPLRTSIARAVALAGGPWSIWIHQRKSWERLKIPAQVVVELRPDPRPEPVSCTAQTTPEQLLAQLEEPRHLRAHDVFDDTRSPPCPVALDALRVLRDVGSDGCALRSRVGALRVTGDRRLQAWRDHWPRLLRLTAGVYRFRKIAPLGGARVLAMCSDPKFWSARGPAAFAAADADALADACRRERVLLSPAWNDPRELAERHPWHPLDLCRTF